MQKKKLDAILAKIAKNHGVTVQEVRKEMQEAMEAGQRSTAPRAKEIWNRIPKKGRMLTLWELHSVMTPSMMEMIRSALRMVPK